MWGIMSHQLIRFCLVGGAATLVHMAVAATIVRSGYPIEVWFINFIAFAVALWVSYFGHRYFTFKTSGSSLKFLATGLTGLAVNNACLAVTVQLTGHKLAAIIVAAAISPVVVFAMSRFWVFK